MNKQKALENAKEFIEYTFIKNIANHDLNKPIETIFSNNVLQHDPNLEVLKQELNKIGYKIISSNKDNWWTILKNK